MQIKIGKKHENQRGKKLSQPDLFPMKLQDDVLEWKIAVNYDCPTNKFILTINDEPFDGMPYLAELTHHAPQNIEKGYIKLNGEELHSGWTQFTGNTIFDWLSKIDQPTTDI